MVLGKCANQECSNVHVIHSLCRWETEIVISWYEISSQASFFIFFIIKKSGGDGGHWSRMLRENTFRFLSSHMGLCLVKGLGKKPIRSASKHHCSKFLATNKHTNHDIFMWCHIIMLRIIFQLSKQTGYCVTYIAIRPFQPLGWVIWRFLIAV